MQNSADKNGENKKAWHKQFWPWFLIILPAIVIIASTTTAVIAFRTADSLVMDNYYREGLAVNQYLERDALAKKLNLQAKISLDSESGEIRAALNNPSVKDPVLHIDFLHAKNESEDIKLDLHATPQGDWLGHLPKNLIGQWYVRLSNDSQNTAIKNETKNALWRLQDSIFLGAADKASSNIEIIVLDAAK